MVCDPCFPEAAWLRRLIVRAMWLDVQGSLNWRDAWNWSDGQKYVGLLQSVVAGIEMK